MADQVAAALVIISCSSPVIGCQYQSKWSTPSFHVGLTTVTLCLMKSPTTNSLLCRPQPYWFHSACHWYSVMPVHFPDIEAAVVAAGSPVHSLQADDNLPSVIGSGTGLPGTVSLLLIRDGEGKASRTIDSVSYYTATARSATDHSQWLERPPCCTSQHQPDTTHVSSPH